MGRKTGLTESEDISGKPYVKYGVDAEPHLRAMFALDFPQYRVTYDKYAMISNNPACPFAFATLDGDLSEGICRGVLEIKTTEILRQSQWKEWDGKIPTHYYIQVVHQLMSTLYDFAVLKARIKYTDRNGNKQAAIRHYFIDAADVQDDIAFLLPQEAAFWKDVQDKKRPNLILPTI